MRQETKRGAHQQEVEEPVIANITMLILYLETHLVLLGVGYVQQASEGGFLCGKLILKNVNKLKGHMRNK